MKVRVEKKIGNGTLWIETGELAKQAAGSVLIGYDETVVLCAATTGPSRAGTDFFPLTCDYRERTAAAGKFPGGFIKREGRPGLKEILTARLIDRPLRPLFPKGFFNEVQIQSLVLACDKTIDPDVLAMNGSAASVLVSSLPFNGPLASIRLGYIGGEFIPFPTLDQLEESELDLIVSGNRENIIMIEGFARELPEDKMLEALDAAHGYIREIVDLQLELIEKVNPQKKPFAEPEFVNLYEALKEKYYDSFWQAKRTIGKLDRNEACSKIKSEARQQFFQSQETQGVSTKVTSDEIEDDTAAELDPQVETKPLWDVDLFDLAWSELEERVVRDQILSGTRPDGRGVTDIRNIECRIGVLPRVHGSAIFQRGETQALVTVTLGTSRDEQRIDGLFDEYTKKFMLDYNFPSFSVGECKPIRGPGRREYGHGALAERSVKPVIPDPAEFPYTVRVVSDILESNGSSSMATVCGTTLGLMAAGVPITNPVAGISVGLVKESDDKWILLTDIMGDEDHFGDMDFKIAGTQIGITGIQLDLKIAGISQEIIKATLLQSREARMYLLRKMLQAIPRPAEDISMYAPRMYKTQIDPDKIGLLIGPGGKTIRGIQERTGASIDIENDGMVSVAAADELSASTAMNEILALTGSVEIGKIYDGQVTSIKEFGAFVEILPGRDGLCHISELSDDYVDNIHNLVRVGDRFPVKVIAVDDHDRIKLSRKAALREFENPNSH
ncbi:MAG: polyribonucleotide nucleotidyltransferase [Planctomycetaceae bacterium]|jgi:polyribonucleotide nucleotidyltransferase|nr:polyribonucleotide nucleotidyltransferase [Planctomycetaceae bacterium]